MDTVHAAFLHSGASFSEDYEPGSFGFYQYRQRDAKFDTIETEYGLCNGAYRPAEADSYYYRITQILWPFFHMIPGGKLGDSIRIGAYVPMDDEHHLQWEIGTLPAPGTQASAPAFMRGHPVTGNLDVPVGTRRLPNTSDWYGRFRSDQNLENDYLIDREAQRIWQTYTGIPGGRIQDCAMTETMGVIYDRSHEHLGTTDTMIIRARRKLIAMARALAEEGTVPPGVDSPEVYRQRSGEIVLPRSSDWWESYKALHQRFNPVVEAKQTPLTAT
jgi:phthalate 4,5-dioxygenase oxygenase subunit